MRTMTGPRGAIAIIILLSFGTIQAQQGKGEGGGGGGERPSGQGTGGGAGDAAAASGSSMGSPADEASSFADWCANASQAAIPGVRAEEIIRVFLPLVKDGFPQSLVRGRIREAAAKRVPRDLALPAFERDADDFAFLLALAKARGWPPARVAEAFFSGASAALRAGVGREAVESVYALSRGTRVDPARAVVALAAASAFRIELGCSEKETSEFAVALASSRMSAKSVSSIVSISAAAKATGLPAAEIRARVIETLRTGGGPKEVKRALSLR